ncbi:metal-sensing transcriptional repressor [Beduinella massiliensis]|uniref:metal-sensing transcriptional repressor n=1 Tax=Beduinella massiliensis TaxID=1852363 RepID=UPI000C840313
MQADHDTVARLLRTARGQIDGVLKMVDEDRYCIDIANQLLAAEAVLRKAHTEVLRAHMKGCVREAAQNGNVDEKIDEVMDILTKLSK